VHLAARGTPATDATGLTSTLRIAQQLTSLPTKIRRKLRGTLCETR
jgi:hypothetical protein